MSRTRILLVDDHALFRQGLARVLETEPALEIVGEVSTVDDALRKIRETPVDLVLLDVELCGERARDFLALLEQDFPGKVLLVTAVVDHGEIARLLRGGARGVFSKLTDASRLLQAIRSVVSGEIWIDQPYLQEFIAIAASHPAAEPQVSGRERQILSLVSRGLTNKEIADELGISEPGVKAGLQRLFQKYGVSNRAQLVAVNVKAAGS